MTYFVNVKVTPTSIPVVIDLGKLVGFAIVQPGYAGYFKLDYPEDHCVQFKFVDHEMSVEMSDDNIKQLYGILAKANAGEPINGVLDVFPVQH